MRKILIAFLLVTAVLTFISCARGITIEQAANGKARCGKNYLR